MTINFFEASSNYISQLFDIFYDEEIEINDLDSLSNLEFNSFINDFFIGVYKKLISNLNERINNKKFNLVGLVFISSSGEELDIMKRINLQNSN